MNTEYRFLEPLDVLYLRGNRLFDGAGAWGPAQMPPWPSLAAGALRSRLLADGGVDLRAFAAGRPPADAALAAALGTPAAPGDFRISHFSLARRTSEGRIEALLPLPADLVVTSEGDDASQLSPLRAAVLAPVIRSSAPLPALALLKTAAPAKPDGGWWLNAAGIADWLAGRTPAAAGLVHQCELWRLDPRLGIALDSTRRSAADGMLYTTEAVAPCAGVGFLVGVQGAHGCLPAEGFVRFGGDGRAAALHAAAGLPQPDWDTIVAERRFRLLLTTPGLFGDGWRPDGIGADGRWQGPGFSARLLMACAGRAGIVSGWDLAAGRPKAAERVVPVGAVYGFEDFDGPVTALQALIADGLPLADAARRAEGFNNVLVAAWPREE